MMNRYRVERWDGEHWTRRAITDQLDAIQAQHVYDGILAAGGAARIVEESRHGRVYTDKLGSRQE